MKNTTTLTSTLRARGFQSALVGIALLTIAGSPAFAGKGNVGNSNVMSPQSHPYGATYAEWAESFWQWAHAGSAFDSPQSGHVWFLASAPFQPEGAPPTVRDITIPAGTSLFASVLSFFDNNDGVDPPFSDEELIEDANNTFDATAVATECIIDGVPVKGLDDPLGSAYRLQTHLYPVTLEDGTTGNEVAVGEFVMIKPLPVGEHTVRLIGSIDVGILLTKDVTYHITVTP
jgi:hypothetical protein